MQLLADSTSSGLGGGVGFLLFVVFYIIGCIPLALVFKKANHPAWAAFVPIYNIYVLLTVVGRPGWWLILFFIPIVNIIIALIVALGISENFGHGAGYGILLWLFAPIMLLVLGFGTDQYKPIRT